MQAHLCRILLLCALLPPLARAQETPSGFEVDGYLRSYVGVRLHGDLDYMATRNRARLNLIYGYDNGRIFLSNDIQNRFFLQPGNDAATDIRYDLREAYLDVYWPELDLRVGRQLVVWGEADGAFITDILSPLDLSEFLTQPFEDIRLGIPAATINYYPGDLAVTAVLTPLPLPSVLPAADSPWNPVPASVDAGAFRIPVALSPAELPAFNLRSGEVAMRLTYYGAPLTTISLIAANAWDRIPAMKKYVDVDPGDPTPEPLSARIAPSYYRRFVLGSTFSTAAWEPFIVRSEIAFHSRRAYDLDMTVPDVDPGAPPSPEALGFLDAFNRQFVGFHPTLHLMAGAERSAAGHLFRLQGLANVALRTEERMIRDAFEPAITFLWNGRYMRDLLMTRVFTYYTIGRDYWINPEATYAIRDALNASAGVHVFGGVRGAADAPSSFTFKLFEQNDFAYIRVQYNF